MIACAICNEPKVDPNHVGICLNCKGELFEDRTVRAVQIKNCPTEIANDIWNAAIEAAAKAADSFTCGGCGMDGKSSEAIRKLKK